MLETVAATGTFLNIKVEKAFACRKGLVKIQ